MTITWYGQSCFRIETCEAVLALDPFSKDIGLSPPRFQADIALITHHHHDHANAAAIGGEPRLISGPGEYETHGISIVGIPTFHDAQRGAKRGPNTCYRLEADHLVLVHLGDFGEAAMSEETAEALGGADILFLPVGGTYTIGAEAAARLTRQLEPKVAIPMHYHLPGLKVKLNPVEEFLKAAGARDAERLEKLSVKKKDLGEDGTRVVVLSKT